MDITQSERSRELAERIQREGVQRAKDALRRKKFDEAVGILEAASAELKGQAEIEDLLQFVREEAATQAKRQVLDVYWPKGAKDLPVVFWIHGGGWQTGDKKDVQVKPKVFTEKD